MLPGTDRNRSWEKAAGGGLVLRRSVRSIDETARLVTALDGRDFWNGDTPDRTQLDQRRLDKTSVPSVRLCPKSGPTTLDSSDVRHRYL